MRPELIDLESGKIQNPKRRLLIQLIKTTCSNCGMRYFILRPACPYCGKSTAENFTKEAMQRNYLLAKEHLGKINALNLKSAVEKGNVIEYLTIVKYVDIVAYHNVVQNVRKGVDVQVFLTEKKRHRKRKR